MHTQGVGDAFGDAGVCADGGGGVYADGDAGGDAGVYTGGGGPMVVCVLMVVVVCMLVVMLVCILVVVVPWWYADGGGVYADGGGGVYADGGGGATLPTVAVALAGTTAPRRRTPGAWGEASAPPEERVKGR